MSPLIGRCKDFMDGWASLAFFFGVVHLNIRIVMAETSEGRVEKQVVQSGGFPDQIITVLLYFVV